MVSAGREENLRLVMPFIKEPDGSERRLMGEITIRNGLPGRKNLAARFFF